MDDLVSVPACNMTSGADFYWKVDTFISCCFNVSSKKLISWSFSGVSIHDVPGEGYGELHQCHCGRVCRVVYSDKVRPLRSAVITIVGGTVPPLTLAPSRSAYICILSGFLSDISWYKYESTPLCLHSYLSNMFGQLFRMCPNVAVVLMFGLALLQKVQSVSC